MDTPEATKVGALPARNLIHCLPVGQTKMFLSPPLPPSSPVRREFSLRVDFAFKWKSSFRVDASLSADRATYLDLLRRPKSSLIKITNSAGEFSRRFFFWIYPPPPPPSTFDSVYRFIDFLFATPGKLKEKEDLLANIQWEILYCKLYSPSRLQTWTFQFVSIGTLARNWIDFEKLRARRTRRALKRFVSLELRESWNWFKLNWNSRPYRRLAF